MKCIFLFVWASVLTGSYTVSAYAKYIPYTDINDNIQRTTTWALPLWEATVPRTSTRDRGRSVDDRPEPYGCTITCHTNTSYHTYRIYFLTAIAAWANFKAVIQLLTCINQVNLSLMFVIQACWTQIFNFVFLGWTMNYWLLRLCINNASASSAWWCPIDGVNWLAVRGSSRLFWSYVSVCPGPLLYGFALHFLFWITSANASKWARGANSKGARRSKGQAVGPHLYLGTLHTGEGIISRARFAMLA